MKRTALYDAHNKLGAKIVDFAGFEMPISYTSISEEHDYVRNKCGIFDVSHMGEIEVWGKDHLDWVDSMVANNVKKLSVNQVVYTPMCYEDGGIVDDLLVFMFDKETYLLVVNAANIEKKIRETHNF